MCVVHKYISSLIISTNLVTFFEGKGGGGSVGEERSHPKFFPGAQFWTSLVDKAIILKYMCAYNSSTCMLLCAD